MRSPCTAPIPMPGMFSSTFNYPARITFQISNAIFQDSQRDILSPHKVSKTLFMNQSVSSQMMWSWVGQFVLNTSPYRSCVLLCNHSDWTYTTIHALTLVAFFICQVDLKLKFYDNFEKSHIKSSSLIDVCFIPNVYASTIRFSLGNTHSLYHISFTCVVNDSSSNDELNYKKYLLKESKHLLFVCVWGGNLKVVIVKLLFVSSELLYSFLMSVLLRFVYQSYGRCNLYPSWMLHWYRLNCDVIAMVWYHHHHHHHHHHHQSPIIAMTLIIIITTTMLYIAFSYM